MVLGDLNICGQPRDHCDFRTAPAAVQVRGRAQWVMLDPFQAEPCEQQVHDGVGCQAVATCQCCRQCRVTAVVAMTYVLW